MVRKASRTTNHQNQEPNSQIHQSIYYHLLALGSIITLLAAQGKWVEERGY